MIKRPDNSFATPVHGKGTKLQAHWTSKAPKRYKRNASNSDLARAKSISTDFESEKQAFADKFIRADFHKHFIASVIKNFEHKRPSHSQQSQ